MSHFQPWGLRGGDLKCWECGVLWVLINHPCWSPKESAALSIRLIEALMTSSISLIYAFITLPLDDCSVSLDMSASYLTLRPKETVKGLILWWTPCLLLPLHSFPPPSPPQLSSEPQPQGPRRNSVFVVLPFFGVEEQEEFNPHCPGDCKGWGGVLRL